MLCTASIMHMCIISLDRYIGIRHPLLAARHKRRNAVAFKIVIAWMSAILISSPILILGFLDSSYVLRNSQCGIFNHNFLIYGSLAAFFIPLLIMLTSYGLTVHVLESHKVKVSSRSRRSCSRQQSVNGDRRTLLQDQTRRQTPRLQKLVKKHQVALKAASLLLQKSNEKRTMATVRTEQKAIRVLGIIVALFIACWAPFFTLNIVLGACKSCTPPHKSVLEAFLWLGYTSSTLNPLVYTLFNRTFRKTFLQILRCKHSSKKNSSLSQTTALLAANTLRLRAMVPRAKRYQEHAEVNC